MVDPISMSLGAAAVAIVSKVAEKTGENVADAGAGAVKQFVAWLRGKFAGHREEEDALKELERIPDNPRLAGTLTRMIDGWAVSDPEFRAELEAHVKAVQAAGVHIQPVHQQATGQGNTQIANSPGAQVNINQSPGTKE